MISFRHHVVSLVAVLLALAAGVALGGGPLSDLGRTASPELRAENDDLRAELSAATSAGDVADEILDGYASKIAAGTLKDLRIAVVTLPGADEEATTGVIDSVEAAGGTVAATYALEKKAYNAAGKSLVDTLGSQLAEGLDAVPDDATTYARLGGVIAAAIVGGDDKATSAASSLASADLLAADEGASAADLVIVIAGDDGARGEADALADLLGGLDAGVDGSVVTATTTSASSGLLKLLRADSDWAGGATSVDSVQTGAGRLNTVLALAADAAGGNGHFGALGADGAAPAL